MSGKLVSRVIEESRAAGTAFAMELVIASHAHDDGTGARLSNTTLAREVRVHPRTVRKLLEELRLLGEVEVIGKPGRINHFRVTRADGQTADAEGSVRPRCHRIHSGQDDT